MNFLGNKIIKKCNKRKFVGIVRNFYVFKKLFLNKLHKLFVLKKIKLHLFKKLMIFFLNPIFFYESSFLQKNSYRFIFKKILFFKYNYFFKKIKFNFILYKKDK